MNEPLISVIIPVYNAEHTLKRAVESLKAQTYPNLEFIFVDDGSTDSSYDILAAYAKTDQRIKVLKQKNEGQNKARFTGLKASSGQYIGFMDNDDYANPQMYRRLMKAITKDDAQIAVCSYQQTMGAKIIKTFIQGKGLFKGDHKVSGTADISGTAFLEKMHNPTDGKAYFSAVLWDKLFDRKLILNAFEHFDYEVKLGEDVALCFETFLKAKRVAIINDPLYYWEMNPHSDSHSSAYLEKISYQKTYQYLKKVIRANNGSDAVLLQAKIFIMWSLLLFGYDILDYQKQLYPFNLTSPKKVVLYGANYLGKAIYQHYQSSKTYQIVGWVDKNAQAYGPEVKSLASLAKLDYDKILVCLFTPAYFEDIKADLQTLGVDLHKVIFIDTKALFSSQLDQIS